VLFRLARIFVDGVVVVVVVFMLAISYLKFVRLSYLYSSQVNKFAVYQLGLYVKLVVT
jgi:hypothetical protein